MKKLLLLTLFAAPLAAQGASPDADEQLWPASELDHAPVSADHKPKTYNRVQLVFMALGANLYLRCHAACKNVRRFWHCLWCKRKKNKADTRTSFVVSDCVAIVSNHTNGADR